MKTTFIELQADVLPSIGRLVDEARKAAPGANFQWTIDIDFQAAIYNESVNEKTELADLDSPGPWPEPFKMEICDIPCFEPTCRLGGVAVLRRVDGFMTPVGRLIFGGGYDE